MPFIIRLQKILSILKVRESGEPGVMIIRPGLPFDQVLALLASAILLVVNNGFNFPFLLFFIVRKLRKVSGRVQVGILTLLCHILFKEGNMESWMQPIIQAWEI